MTNANVFLSIVLLSSALACTREEAPAAIANEGPRPASEAVATATAPATGEPEGEGAHACAGNCGSDCGDPVAAAPGAPAQVVEADARAFGSALNAEREVTPLATLLERPSDFDGQVVKTEGVIAQVCQRMGCWMELRGEEGGPAVRVPMAGHSFFLPRDVAGRRATVEGTVQVRVLDRAAQEHLRSEGAQAADQALGISASGVIVHGA